MHPELFNLPGGFSIKTYGFFMMIGFLSGVWLAMRRAAQVKADPDTVLDISLVCLLFGIGGARIFYVIHYWKSQFADSPSPLLSIIDITSGGLEFLGGFLGAVIATCIHAWWKKYSLRLYLDIMAPSAMWGLGIGRIGCFFNGCCFGAVAATGGPHPDAVSHNHPHEVSRHVAAVSAQDAPAQPDDHVAKVLLVNQTPPASRPAAPGRLYTPTVPWAVEFPYGSPAHIRHWEQRRVTVPAELINTPRESLQPFLVPESQLAMNVEKRQGMFRKVQDLERAYKAIKDQNTVEAKKLRREYETAVKDMNLQIGALREAQSFPSRINPQRQTSVSELEQLAAQCRSVPVHPAQLYATVGAVLLSILLTCVFYRRKRHGVVIGLVLLLYPIQRTLEEIIRADNPQDVAGLTVSQSISVGLFLLGAAYLYVLYTKFPERSPLAVAHESAG